MRDPLVLVVLCTAAAFGQADDPAFRWMDQGNAVYEKVETAFAQELQPDPDDPNSRFVPMKVKFLQRVGVVESAALVVLAEKENRTDPYTISHAYNFDVKSGAKTALRHEGSRSLWQWTLVKVAHFTSRNDVTVVFQFLSCTECESTRFLSGFRYSKSTRRWEVQEWEDDGPELMIGSDIQHGDEGHYHYDCLHVVKDLTTDGLDDVAIRCRERLQPDPAEDRMKTLRDELLLYTAKEGKVARLELTHRSPMGRGVGAALCATKKNSPLCRQPGAQSKPK